jgi:hypothetical protein
MPVCLISKLIGLNCRIECYSFLCDIYIAVDQGVNLTLLKLSCLEPREAE